MTSARPDVLVIGGGPIGLFTAITCRQRGLTVRVVEQRTGALDKACGEGLMPGGVQALARAGVKIRASASFRGIQFHSGSLTLASDFAEGHGHGIRRTELSRALRERALELGSELLEGTRVTGLALCTQSSRRYKLQTTKGSLSAATVVAADGLNSPTRRALQINETSRYSVFGVRKPRYGVRAHFAVRPWSEHVEVEFIDQGELYVTPVSEDTVGVALLSYRPLDYHAAIARSQLSRRITTAQQLSPPRGAGPLFQRASRRVVKNVALVGDAAGYVDAITGEGLSLGFACAEALAGCIAAGQLARYESDYRRLSRNYHVTTRAMLWLAAHPTARHLLLRALSHDTQLMTQLLSINDGSAKLTSLNPLRLVVALARSLKGHRVPKPEARFRS